MQIRMARYMLGMLTSVVVAAQVPQSWASECSAEEHFGHCEGDEARWCEDGRWVAMNCATYGLACGRSETSAHHRCQSAQEPTPCGEGLDATGICINNLLVWCKHGWTEAISCDYGTVCGWNGAEGYFDCLPPGDHLPAPFSPGPASQGKGGEPDKSAEESESSPEWPEDWMGAWPSAPSGDSGDVLGGGPPSVAAPSATPELAQEPDAANSQAAGCATSGKGPSWVGFLLLGCFALLRPRD